RQQARPDFDPATSVVLGVPAARMPLLVYAVAAFELFLLSAYFNPGFWILAFLAIVFALVLRFTVLGRYCYAIGSNEPTARLCGVSVENYKVAIYTLTGLVTGVAGVILFAQGTSGNPSAGEELTLDVIAAVVLGGATSSGGPGT